MGRGLFIVLEGLDGCGSTTQASKLVQYLEREGERTFLTNQPSNGPAGMLIRLALTHRLVGANHRFHADDGVPAGPADLDPKALALLYAADRLDHLATQIEPCLASGRHVVCDRYVMSALAYQGVHVDEQWLRAINQHAPQPDITIYLRISAAAATERMQKSRWTRDLFETEALQAMIEQNFERLAQERASELGVIVAVDAARPPRAVTHSITRIIERLLSARR